MWRRPLNDYLMYYVVRCTDFDKSRSLLQTFSSRDDAEEFAWFRRRDEKDDHVRYVVTDDYSFACPVVDVLPLCWSVGRFFGKRRVPIAWFGDERSACDYARRSAACNPGFKYDYLKSSF